MRKLSIEEVKNRIFLKHNDTVVLDTSTYKDTHTKCKFFDKDFGEFWNSPKNVMKGQGNIKRSNEKLEQTNLKKYGVRRPLQNKKIHEKYIKTNLKKYGTENPIQNERIKEKIKQNNLITYGVEWVTQNEIVKQKIAETNLEKYGFTVCSKSEQVKNNMAVSNEAKYGNSCTFQATQFKEKIIKKFIEKYGADNPMKNKAVQEKAKKTNLERYGFEFPIQNELVKEKSRNTCFEHLGVMYPQQDLEVARKTAKSRNNSTKVIHWKTGKEIVCTASYERRVVEYFNNNKIDFVWQENKFEMDDGSDRIYIPDCYLPSEDKWIEIKGYFWKDAKEKWEWFHGKYVNSELWNRSKLKDMKIL